MLFDTPRLIVRQMTQGDVDAMHSVYGDPEAVRYVDDGQPLTREECEVWVAVTHTNYERYGYGMSPIVLKSTGAVIGFIGIVHPNGQVLPEIKYAFRRDCWGQGYASEAAAAMIAFISESFDKTQVIATIDPANGASRRVLQKAGMRHLQTRIDADGDEVEVLVWNRDGSVP